MQPKFKCINKVWSKPENKQYNTKWTNEVRSWADPQHIYIAHTKGFGYWKTSRKDQANRKLNTQVQTMFNLTLK